MSVTLNESVALCPLHGSELRLELVRGISMSGLWAVQIEIHIVVAQCSVQCLGTPGAAACQSSLSSAIPQSLLKFMFIESVMLSNHLILCRPLLLLPLTFPSVRVFSNGLCPFNNYESSNKSLHKMVYLLSS